MKTACKVKHDCPGCGKSELTGFFRIDQLPVFCNVFYDSRDQAGSAVRGDIELVYCGRCGLISNAAFDSSLVEYSGRYENSLHFSPKFQGYAQAAAAGLVERCQLYDKDVIEIGCGQGDFLSILQKAGNNRAMGFDPSFRGDENRTDDVKIVPELFCADHADHPADLICCRHVLEHIEHPLEFLKTVRRTVGQRKDTVIFFEVPNAAFTLCGSGVWDVIYEHCNYFTHLSLERMFVRAGFKPIRIAEEYDGQFLTIEALPVPGQSNAGGDLNHTIEMLTMMDEFKNVHQSLLKRWQGLFEEFEKSGSRVVLWGAGSKGVTFLNVLGVGVDQIEYAVDLNPAKQGSFIAGTGQQIVPPGFLKEYRPDYIIIMNAIYQEEIEDFANQMGINCQFLLA